MGIYTVNLSLMKIEQEILLEYVRELETDALLEPV